MYNPTLIRLLNAAEFTIKSNHSPSNQSSNDLSSLHHIHVSKIINPDAITHNDTFSTYKMPDASTTTGWKNPPDGRGTFDIIKTCFGTVFLLCWSSVCPNAPGPHCGRWSSLAPRFKLFLLALLGPDFVLMVALGQLTAAWRAKNEFQAQGHASWTLRQCFYVNMGSLHLRFPDCPASFPVDCQQLLYLHDRGYMSLPELSDEEVDDRNKSDTLSRLIAVVQSFWFVISTLGRISQNLHVSTLELTTLAFVFLMTACSLCWWRKPMDITQPNVIYIQQTQLATIHRETGSTESSRHGRTPLSYLNRDEWFLGQIWTSYICLLRKLKIVPGREDGPAAADHFPSIEFPEVDFRWELVSGVLIMAYSAIFMAAWNFDFPTLTERTLWRVSGVISFVYGVLGCVLAWCWKNRLKLRDCLLGKPSRLEGQQPQGTEKSRIGIVRCLVDTSGRWFEWMRNMTPDQDPAMRLPARLWLATSVLCSAYLFARLYILVEDVVGLRELPGSAYDTVNWGQFSPIL